MDPDDPDGPEELELPPADWLELPDPPEGDPPTTGAGACTDGSDGVETVGVCTGGGLGNETGGGVGPGTETVGGGSVGVETEGVETVGVETVGTDTEGVDTLGVDSDTETDGTVRAALGCG